MTKLYIKKIDKCSSCPHGQFKSYCNHPGIPQLVAFSYEERLKAFELAKSRTSDDIPDWCPLLDLEDLK